MIAKQLNRECEVFIDGKLWCRDRGEPGPLASSWAQRFKGGHVVSVRCGDERAERPTCGSVEDDR